jgi:hypothetical protein
VEFRLLGPIEVWAAGRRVPVSSAQQRTLLAVLLLHANRVVPTERLVELLWGAAPPRTARSVVQVQVSGLRRLLRAEPGVDRLVFRWPGYLLRVEPGELDLEEFLRLTEQGREALGAGSLRGLAPSPCRAATADGPGTSTPTSTAAATTACDHGRRTPLKVPPIARQDWRRRRYESAAHGSLTGG